MILIEEIDVEVPNIYLLGTGISLLDRCKRYCRGDKNSEK
jgi:hypothetical protein